MATKNVDGQVVTLTPEEETALAADRAQRAANRQAEADAEKAAAPSVVRALLEQARADDPVALALAALALTLLDRVNVLEADHGRPGFTAGQLRSAIETKAAEILA